MFDRLLNRGRPLVLTIDGQDFSFNTVQEFEFALSGRTHITYGRVKHSLALSGEELLSEARGIKKVETHFVDLLASSFEEHTSIGRHFKTMDIKLFSQDHDWRTIMEEMAGQDDYFENYKRVALVKYMQYLTTRQEVVQSIYADRLQRREAGSGPEGSERPQDEAFRETVIFDLSRNPPPAPENDTGWLARMPKGEAVEIPLEAARDVTIMLSKHRFHLIGGETCRMVDEEGREFPLHAGKNFAGRQAEADIPVNTGFRDVSRKHLIIDLVEPGLVRLTDISSHGTFIPHVYLDRTVDR